MLSGNLLQLISNFENILIVRGMIRNNTVTALLQDSVSGANGPLLREAVSFLVALCRDGMTDTEIGITLERISPMMRFELIVEIRALALRIGIVLPQAAATT